MSLIDRITDVNRRIVGRQYYRLRVNGRAVGFIDAQFLPELDKRLFVVDDTTRCVSVRFNNRSTFEKQIAAFFRSYFDKHQLDGWRDEYYTVADKYNDEPLFLLERSALPFLGVIGYGVHVNGYVEQADGLFMWVAKRSSTKPTAPGKLDQIAAGGQPYAISTTENVIKECEEEASIPESLARKAVPVSTISYWYDRSIGMRQDVIFNYDLRLPLDFKPQVNDDEVDCFKLYSMPEVLDIIANTRQFKLNSAVVIIDFAIRHGVITPQDPDYLALSESMNLRRQRIWEEEQNILSHCNQKLTHGTTTG
ncbi:MAG: DUF4743 domain-containing protein [Gammaproteobacteria bacterium]|nr:MAG: DUF4743 domain-containing protein [Gammaproteobacteria bacterium]